MIILSHSQSYINQELKVFISFCTFLMKNFITTFVFLLVLTIFAP